MTDERQINPAKRLGIFILICLLVVIVLSAVLWIQWLNRPAERTLPAESPAVPPVQTPVAASAGLKGQYYYAGMPRVTSYPNRLQVLTNIGYVVGYDNERRDPVWVCYRVFKVASLQAPPRPEKFSIDVRTRARVSTADYTGSGYDRGHCAPNYAIAVCYGAQAQLETFQMSNILPQRPKLNREVWENIERREIRD